MGLEAPLTAARKYTEFKQLEDRFRNSPSTVPVANRLKQISGTKIEGLEDLFEKNELELTSQQNSALLENARKSLETMLVDSVNGNYKDVISALLESSSGRKYLANVILALDGRNIRDLGDNAFEAYKRSKDAKDLLRASESGDRNYLELKSVEYLDRVSRELRNEGSEYLALAVQFVYEKDPDYLIGTLLRRAQLDRDLFDKEFSEKGEEISDKVYEGPSKDNFAFNAGLGLAA